MSKYNKKLADQGDEGETALNKWLKESGFAYLFVKQNETTFADLFLDNLKRPDFLVLIDSVGLIAVDAKNYTPGDRFGEPAYSLNWQEELRRTLAFERLFRIPVWYAYKAFEDNLDVWYWISALKAVEVGQPAKGKNDEEFLWIPVRDCVRVFTPEDFSGIYNQRLRSIANVTALADKDKNSAK